MHEGINYRLSIERGQIRANIAYTEGISHQRKVAAAYSEAETPKMGAVKSASTPHFWGVTAADPEQPQPKQQSFFKGKWGK